MLKKVQNTQVNKNPYDGREGLVYVRVSSKKQETEGHGRESQEGRCKKELLTLGVIYNRTFPDTYTGGGDFIERPAMKAMLDYIDAYPHKKFVVIFDDLKRFARDTVFHLKLRTALKARDVLPQCLNYKFDDSPEGMFVETVLAAGNELERHQNRRQVVQKMKARLEAGYWPFGVKRGYKMIKDPIHGKLSVPNENEAKTLIEALEGFSSGIFIRKIDACKYLVEKGFWKGEPKRYVYLFDKMLRDPFHAGYIEYSKWEVARRPGHHKAIIPLETFELNQKRLGVNQINKKIRKDVSDDLVLRGLLNCGECGEHLSGGKTEGNGGIYWYYFCQNRKCKMFRKSISRVEISKRFKKLLTENTLKPIVGKLARLIFDRTWEDEVNNLQKTEKEKSFKKKNLEEKIEKFSDMAVATFSEKLRSNYEKQIEKAMTELEETTSISLETPDLDIPYQTALNKATLMLKSPYKIWEIVDTAEKHRLFFFLFEEKLPYSKKDGYTTNKIPSAVRLFEEFATPSTNDVDPSGLEPLTSSLQMRRSTR